MKLKLPEALRGVKIAGLVIRGRYSPSGLTLVVYTKGDENGGKLLWRQ